MKVRGSKYQMSNTLSFLVDAASLADDPELPYLFLFCDVEGLSIEQHIALVERPGQDSKAVLGATGTRHVSLAPLNQFKRFAVEIAARPGCQVSADVVERALAYSFLADRLNVDAVVSPGRSAFGPGDKGLLDTGALVTVAEALAMIGANVRLREDVPLGGSPFLTQDRSEAYPLTAKVIIPNGQDWWASCVQTAPSPEGDLLGYAGAVFKRVGQALRGRDAVHEALRLGGGRSAILDALYHFDVVLTSSVASLDALARVAHEVFGTSSAIEKVGWQRPWRNELDRIVPVVAGVVAPDTRLGAALLILTRMRNSIHSIPLDEYLQVVVKQQGDLVEHRVMVARDLALRLRTVATPLGPLDGYGIFVDDTGVSFINIAQLTEQLLAWTIEIIGELFRAMLSCSQFVAGIPVDFGPLEPLERELCAKLARVGEYPCRRSPKGLPAAPSLHRTVMASIHEHLPRE
jgi:hypothetical protein